MPMDARKKFGNNGEERAAAFLVQNGFIFVEAQCRTPFGEIDLVCEDRGVWVFVEVKTRRNARYGAPESAITRAKFRHMAACAEAYAFAAGKHAKPWRLDVVAVEWPQGTMPTFRHYRGIDGPASF